MHPLKPIVAAAFTLAALDPASAQQPIVLKVADSFPVGHYIPANTVIPWMKKVEELTKGKVKFEYYPAEQLGKAKDLFSNTRSGVIDIGYVPTSYVSDKLPLSAVGELPGSFESSCVGTMAFWQIAKPGGELDKAEYQRNGVRMLMVHVLPPYQFMSASKPIVDIASFKNLKTRTAGGALGLSAQKIGAIPVQMSGPEMRESLSRGTLDALLLPNLVLAPWDLESQVRYVTSGVNFGSTVNPYMIRQEKWASLPPDVQAVMTQAGEAANRSGCEAAEKLETEVSGRLAKGKVTYVKFSDAEKAKLNKSLSEVSKDWAAGLDGRNLPGKRILDTFQQAVKAAEKR
ncbi:MAG: TRAP transporter substrate-binding protein DctP [Rubrivivax sp.]